MIKQIVTFGAMTLCVIWLGACASIGYEKAASTSSTLEKAAQSIDQGNAQLDAVLASLNDLVNNPGSDLRKQYKRFSSDVDKLQSLATTVRRQADSMNKGGAAYVSKWDEELALIQNESIYNRSADRRNLVAAQFAQIQSGYDKTRADFAPFMLDLIDIRTALGTDLTVGGLMSIRDIVEKAKLEAVPLRSSLNQLASDFKQMGVLLSPRVQ